MMKPCRCLPPLMIGPDGLLPEILEPPVSLSPMTAGREVVEDYRSTGLSLRNHPVRFLREHLGEQGYQPCASCEPPETAVTHHDCWARAGPANAGFGERRHVHHARR